MATDCIGERFPRCDNTSNVFLLSDVLGFDRGNTVSTFARLGAVAIASASSPAGKAVVH